MRLGGRGRAQAHGLKGLGEGNFRRREREATGHRQARAGGQPSIAFDCETAAGRRHAPFRSLRPLPTPHVPAAMSLLLNVKLPPPPNAEQPHLTRFQAKQPPHLLGTTLLNIPCEPSDSVAQLRKKVEGAWAAPAAGKGRRKDPEAAGAPVFLLPLTRARALSLTPQRCAESRWRRCARAAAAARGRCWPTPPPWRSAASPPPWASTSTSGRTAPPTRPCSGRSMRKWCPT